MKGRAFPGRIALLILLVLLCGARASAGATLTLHCRTAMDLELVGYDGLAERVLFQGRIAAGGNQAIATPYQGFALLRFGPEQGYPVLLGDAPLAIHLAGPTEPPTFAGSGDNEFFSSRLAGKAPAGPPSNFALLLLRAKELLDSTQTLRTVPELTAKKEELHAFVREHYASLRHSDMVRRLLGQYLMMHEYVDYGGHGTAAADIRTRHEQAVIDGVGTWLALLRPHVPETATLNYCLSLYYQRSMVTLAARIAAHFPRAAHCPGAAKEDWSFPSDLRVVDAEGQRAWPLATIKGDKLIALVSEDCPASLVATVIQARQIADQGQNVQLIVAPVQQLSQPHLRLNSMVSNGTMLFVDDERWRKAHLAEPIRLPLFVPLEAEPTWPARPPTNQANTEQPRPIPSCRLAQPH